MELPSVKFRDDPESSTGLLFIRAYNHWHGVIKRELHRLGITHPQFVVLTSLCFLAQSNENITQVSIARMADMDVMTLSQIIKVLEKKDFLLRSVNPDDSRANRVILLEKGRRIIEQSLPIVESIDEKFFGVLGGDEAVLRKYLQRLC